MKIIEINLLSEETKSKHKAQAAGPGPDKSRLLLFALLILPAALLGVNFYLAVLGQAKGATQNQLIKEWDGLAAQRKQVEDFNERYALDAVYGQEQQKLLQQRISWAQKLNTLSLDLPSGVWFNDISINSSELVIKGSAVSLEKLEMSLIKALIDNLKGQASFSQDFTSYELGTVQKRTLGNIDVVDFILTCKIKAR